jgi:hypothetical protein
VWRGHPMCQLCIARLPHWDILSYCYIFNLWGQSYGYY